MCVMSLVQEHYIDKWWPNQPQQPVTPWDLGNPQYIPNKMPTQEEIQEFRILLDKARKYDEDHNQPDCELDVKRQILTDLAKHWGIELYTKENEDAT